MMLDRFWSDTLNYLEMPPATQRPVASGKSKRETP